MKFRYALFLVVLFFIAACDFKLKPAEPPKITSFEISGCPMHLLTGTISDSRQCQKRDLAENRLPEAVVRNREKLPPASTYALVQARFDCSSREVSVKKYMLMGTGEKVIGEMNDVREMKNSKKARSEIISITSISANKTLRKPFDKERI